jgi:GT2 family glycosyltransferase
MSKISIIIPAYNQARYLDRAITSALGQKDADVEVVVVDDGSTDETPAIIARFAAEPRLKSVRQANAGLAGARNRGLAEAAGEYVCFLDADDFYDPEKCAKQAALLDANPDLGFVYCDFTTVDEAGAPCAEQGSVRDIQRTLSGNIFPALAQSGFFPPHTVMIRRQVLDAVGHFDLELGGHADYDLWLRAAAEHRALYLDEKLASYCQHGDSMSKDGDHMVRTRIGTLRKISRLHPDLVGTAMHQLQQSNEDLFQANAFLREVCDKVPAPAAGGGSLKDGDQVHALMKHVSEARVVQGQANQMAVWDVIMNEQPCKALLLQPPLELLFELPTGAPGVFAVQIGLHPDVWDKPEGGACEFQIQIDRRMALAMVIDPTHLPDDRRWHAIRLEVPASPRGNHQISIRTRSPNGANAFRWALCRNPHFSWNPA